jgi:hypothetical protein
MAATNRIRSAQYTCSVKFTTPNRAYPQQTRAKTFGGRQVLHRYASPRGQPLYVVIPTARRVHLPARSGRNHIKSWKTHLAADRTSCTKATANQSRLFLHPGSYWLMWALRVSMPKRSMWRVAQVRHVAPAAHQYRRPRRRDEDNDPGSLADVVSRPGYCAARTRAYPALRHLKKAA